MIPIANPIIGDKEKKLVLDVMDSGMLASGSYVSKFEKEFASFIGSRYGVATSSGTTALHVALEAAGIGRGDKVLTTPFTFIASSNSILYADAEPVFADIERDSFNLDPRSIRSKLEQDREIKALLIVHLYGMACDMDPIMELVEEFDLVLIEDCAQSHGAKYKGKNVGTFGDAAIFSFYPTKNMTTGEGGIVLTDDQEIMNRSRLLVNHGAPERYYHQVLGYNYRMTNLAAAIGLAQLENLAEFNQQRRENAAYLTQGLQDLDWLQTPVVIADYQHVYHQYTVRVEERERFVEYLKENGIGYGIHYPIPAYQQPLYQKLGYGEINLPVVEEAAGRVVSLPVHPALSKQDLERVVEVVRNFK